MTEYPRVETIGLISTIYFSRKFLFENIKDIKDSLLSTKVRFKAKNNIISCCDERQLKEVSVFVNAFMCIAYIRLGSGNFNKALNLSSS